MSSQMAALEERLEKKIKQGTEPEEEQEVTTQERLSQPDDDEDVDWGSHPEASRKRAAKKIKRNAKSDRVRMQTGFQKVQSKCTVCPWVILSYS